VRILRFFKALFWLALFGFAGMLLYGYSRNHPEDMPWTELDLTRPIGAFTGRKLARIEGAQCQGLLETAGVRFDALPRRKASAQCGYDDAVRFSGGGALEIGYRPSDLGTSCKVAAGLALWEWHVVQPAALEHFGQKVAGIEHFGSYSCRRIYGRTEGQWSEHSTANAVDIAAFRLEDGSRVSLIGDWNDAGPKSAFLRDVRDGACKIFASVLSPDYNAAHRDHFHFDQRGTTGWRACR
jgi:hypothetical protein